MRIASICLALVGVGVGCAFSDPIDVSSSAGGTSGDVTGSPSSSTGTDMSSSVGGAGAGGVGGASSSTGTPDPVCGDGAIDGNEECDDANLVDGDGCTTCVVDCEAEAVKHANTHHCYRFYPVAKTWAAAEGDCEAWGGASGLGHLVSIEDAAEQSFVVALSQGAVWIGARDIVTEGTYAWIDGTPFNFTSYAPGKPDGATVQNCLNIRADNFGWDDQPCGGSEPGFVCERIPASKTP